MSSAQLPAGTGLESEDPDRSFLRGSCSIGRADAECIRTMTRSCSFLAAGLLIATTFSSADVQWKFPRDDAPRLEAQLRISHKLVLEPNHVYNIASHIVVRGGPVTIVGNNATLRASDRFETADAGGDMLFLIDCGPVSLQDVVFDQNKTHRGRSPECNPVAVRLSGCSDFRVTGCHFLDSPADSIRIAATDPVNSATACHDGRIDHNVFVGAYRNGISVIAGAKLRIDHNSFADIVKGQAPNAAVDVEPNSGDALGIANNITLDCNAIHRCVIGIAIYKNTVGTHDVTISNNAAVDCGYGVISEGYKTQIIGNALVGCGIAVQNSDAATVMGNVMANGTIYADTHGLTEPLGHTISQNVTDKIDVHYCYGHVRLNGNIGTVSQ
jgi:hypothetical protein